MDGDAEIRQLAHLLRVIATTARDIAELRDADICELCGLATQAEGWAAHLDSIADRSTRTDAR